MKRFLKDLLLAALFVCSIMILALAAILYSIPDPVTVCCDGCKTAEEPQGGIDAQVNH